MEITTQGRVKERERCRSEFRKLDTYVGGSGVTLCTRMFEATIFFVGSKSKDEQNGVFHVNIDGPRSFGSSFIDVNQLKATWSFLGHFPRLIEVE
ncbi:hypothetical protein ACFX15_003141 [Malus domestica]